METLLMLLATGLVLRIPSPKLQRYLIGTTGATSLLYTAGKNFTCQLTADGDRVYFNEYSRSGVVYGLICVEMKNLYGTEEAEKIITEYLAKLQPRFNILHTLGMYAKPRKNFLLVTDYWQDAAGFDWSVKAYTNGKTIGVLYVKNIAGVSVEEQDNFLEGFSFS